MKPDQTIGRYKIVERVGRGGMGVLYRGLDPVLDREVAIKVMSADFSAGDEGPDEESRARFFREARAAAKLQHRNIVTIFEFAEEEGVPYIVMEFLRGRSLAARMRAEPALTLEEKLDVMTELCTGLDFAHEHGVIHRDVKPGNVWMLDDGTVKLLDFGIAKVSTATFTRHGEILGSASYMAPEQLNGGAVDARADVFAASVVLYELLAGRKPFESDSPTATLLKIMQEEPPPLQSIVPDLPESLIDVAGKGLQKNPADRYQTAGDLGSDLQLIRMAIQSTADTVMDGLGTDDDERPSEKTIVDVDAMRRNRTMVVTVPQRTGAVRTMRVSTPAPAPVPVPAPAPAASNKLPWVLGLAAVVVMLAGVGWYGMSLRSGGDTTTGGTTVGNPPGGVIPPPPRTDPKPVPTLRVETDPPGATIELDGKDTRLVTPATLEIADPAPKRLRLTKRGYQPIETPITDATIAGGALNYRLTAAEQAVVKIEATGTYPFEITDGRRVLSAAATSHSIAAAPGQVLRLRATTYLLDYPFRVDGSRRSIEVSAPELGRLTVRSTMETCQVIVNGHELGFPPINSQLVAAGTYSVQLRCPDGQVIRGSGITIMPGQTSIAKVQ